MGKHLKGVVNQKCSHKGAAPKTCNTFTEREDIKVQFQSLCIESKLKPHFDDVARTQKLTTHLQRTTQKEQMWWNAPVTITIIN